MGKGKGKKKAWVDGEALHSQKQNKKKKKEKWRPNCPPSSRASWPWR
jgi:hypothetical protein